VRGNLLGGASVSAGSTNRLSLQCRRLASEGASTEWIMKRKNILYVHQSGGGGGASTSLGLLVRSLDRRKYEPIALLGSDGPVAESFREQYIATYIRRLSTIGVNTHSPTISAIAILGFLIRFLPNVIAVYRIIKDEKIELVHINSSVLLTSAIASRLAGVKVVWHIRELIPSSRIGALQKRLIELLSTEIIAISKEVKKQFNTREPYLAYNGINLEAFKPTSGIEALQAEYRRYGHETIFTHIGQLFPAKGSFVFLEAAKLVIESGHNVRFFVIGGRVGSAANGATTKVKNVVKRLLGHKAHNWKEELENFATELGIAGKVSFTGYRDDVANFISLSDAVVVPHCVPEPFGRTLIEAGALRKPVISTNIPPTPEIVVDGETGLLVEPNKPEALAEAMEYIVNNPREARKMGENGYQNVANNFRIDVTHAKIVSIYEKLAERG